MRYTTEFGEGVRVSFEEKSGEERSILIKKECLMRDDDGWYVVCENQWSQYWGHKIRVKVMGDLAQ